MISATITDASGRTLSGQTAEAFELGASRLALVMGLNRPRGRTIVPMFRFFIGWSMDLSAHTPMLAYPMHWVV